MLFEISKASCLLDWQDSKIETYQKMWRYMDSKRQVSFVSTYDDGIKKVLDSNYAFLMESTSLDYVVQRNCNLTQVIPYSVFFFCLNN